MKPYYTDSTVTLWHGANLDVLPQIEDGSIDCVVTSPPYFGLRSYLPEDHPDKAQEFGAEPTPAEFVANLVATFREIRRVLADDGVIFINLGDSYSTGINLGGPAYGMSGTALAGSTGGGSSSSCRCDGHRESRPAAPRTSRSGIRRAPESAPCACDPTPDRTASRCSCLDDSGSAHRSPTLRSSHARPDPTRTHCHEDAPPPVSQESMPDGFDLPRLDGCSRSANDGADPSTQHSCERGAQECGRRSACTCDIGSTSDPSDSRRSDTASLDSAYPDSTNAFLPAKNLLGMPWRTAFALQDDGWILRNAIIWHKPNAMPESVTDRLSTRYEMLFMFSKSRKYHFDLDPIREERAREDRSDAVASAAAKQRVSVDGDSSDRRRNGGPQSVWDTGRYKTDGRNPGDVWTIPTSPFPGSHFAVFPPEIPRRCILAGCKPGGTVLDPFHGSGTTGMVAQRLGRKYVGIELNKEYIDLSLRTRLADGVLDFEEPV